MLMYGSREVNKHQLYLVNFGSFELNAGHDNLRVFYILKAGEKNGKNRYRKT